MARSKPRRIFLFTTVIILSIVFGGSFGVLTAYFRTTPDLTDVQFRQSFTTHIFDVNGRLITDLFREHRVPVSIYDVPKHVKEAVIAIEDDRFYEHHGVNFYAFGRAIIVNLREQRFAQGGGTITMQLARNVFLTQDKTVVRKLEEFLWAWQIERQYSKEEILEAYLNEVHVGHGANGVEAASQLYFGKSVNQLTLSEAAMIAGVIRWPVRYSPFNNPDIAVERRDFVLSRMQELGYISAQEAQSARAEELNPTARTGRVVNAPYFVDYIIQELTPLFGEDRIFGGGLRIHTSLEGSDGEEITLKVSITDTGVGIAEGKIDLLFQVFTQADPSHTRLYGGTGLGLAIAKNIVEHMGGKIWAESMRGKGSTFTFTTRMKSVAT